MYNPIPAIGTTSLGIVIGWLVRYFIRRFEKFTPAVLSTIISLAFGGVAVKFLDADRSLIWFYPIGVLLGFIVYQIIATTEVHKEEKDAKKSEKENKPDKPDKPSHGGGSGGGGSRWGPGGKNQPLFEKK